MQKLIFGTGNRGKMEFMQQQLTPLGIVLLSLKDVAAPDLQVDESGNDPLENAKIKAMAYYQALKAPVFSCDSGLYIEGLDAARQPGVHVRNIGSRRLTDDEMIAYYGALAGEMGGQMVAKYHNGICLVLDEAHVYAYIGEDTASESFFITQRPHHRRREGFPLDSLAVHIQSGKYYYDLNEAEKEELKEDGFAAFFKRSLNL